MTRQVVADASALLVTANDRLLNAVGAHLPFVQPLWEYSGTA